MRFGFSFERPGIESSCLIESIDEDLAASTDVPGPSDDEEGTNHNRLC